MKSIQTLAIVCAFCATSAYAVDPQPADMTCDEVADKYEMKEGVKERFADLEGACEGVYTIDGALYVRAEAVIRSKRGGKVTLYVPATDHTFDVTPDPQGRVWVGGRKMRVRDLGRGDELGIYLSVDKLASERVDTVAFATADESEEEIVVHDVEEVAALPTTG
jgi:hypothetical protein